MGDDEYWTPDDEACADGMLCRLQMLLHAAATAPGDGSVLECALVQAAAATGADSVVLGTMRGREMDVVLLSGAGVPMHDVGALQVSRQYPLTDVVVREKAIWLESALAIRHAYPTGGMLWGQAFAAVPLLARGVAVGAIGVIHDAAGHEFSAAERAFLSAVADLCVTVLAHPSHGGWPRAVPAVDL